MHFIVRKSMKDVFRFKNFTVCQSRSAMKVGTDAVLLGAWANGGNNILDIGAGTGIVSLMMAQRFSEAFVTGVEIDDAAAGEASDNAQRSPFGDRIRIINKPIQRFVPSGKYDAIVTNPPFFTHGYNTPDSKRRQARQSLTLTFHDILIFCKEWLNEKAELSVILPVDAMEEFSEEAFLQGFFMARKCMVKTVSRKVAKRCLLAFSLIRPADFEASEVTMLDPEGKKSEWYRKLTEEFYL